MCSLSRKFTMLWAVSLLLLAFAGGAIGAIHACPTSDGATIFQDRPCARNVPVESKAMATARAPLGIHDSWFVKPAQIPARAFCNDRGCECDNFYRSHNGSTDRAVADALYIDASWHHYELSEIAWQQTPENTARRYAMRAELIEASCSLLMSQQLLKQFAELTAEKLKKQAQQAEERGFDIPDACDNGDETACELYDARVLYQRLSRDAGALRQSRSSLGGF